MKKELIVSSNRHETMAAILEDDQVSEVFIERERQRGVVGNIYKGRVNKVLPGMQCSFVDIGLDRDAFLYVSDVIDTVEEFDRLEAGETEDEAGSGGHGRSNGRPDAKIEDLLTAGQEILVQVAKEPLGTKGARITSHVTVPGRFLVFMPSVDHIGVSRKIDSRSERSRLRGIVKKFRDEHGFTGGVILRTAAAGRPEEDIVGDLDYFHQLWTATRERMEKRRAPSVVHREESLVAKLIRDFLTRDFSTIRIDDRSEYERTVKLVERIMPDLVSRVRHYDKAFPIFEEYGVQAEIDKALRSKVWLKSGGYIVINHTEALVAIDVNTGRYVGKRTGRLEDTIVKTNLEAVKEIVRQIRLRDLGGIIVLDFIDMEERKNRQKVAQLMEQELRRDRSPSKAVSGARVWADCRHTKAGEAESRAATDGAMPVLLGELRRQVELDHLLRHPVGNAKSLRRARRPGGCATRQSGHRAVPQRRGTGRDEGTRRGARPTRDHQAGYATSPRAVRRDGGVGRAIFMIRPAVWAALRAGRDPGRRWVGIPDFGKSGDALSRVVTSFSYPTTRWIK